MCRHARTRSAGNHAYAFKKNFLRGQNGSDLTNLIYRIAMPKATRSFHNNPHQ